LGASIAKIKGFVLNIDKFINRNWQDAAPLKIQYANARPFPHFVMQDFIRENILNEVETEFPDLKQLSNSVITYCV